MRRHFIALISVLLLVTLLIGCETSKDVLKNSTISISTGAPIESANKNNSTSLSENTLGLELKEKFLNSKEGHDFQVISWKFAKAYLSGDVSMMKNYLIDPENKEHYYNTENRFNNVEFLILKLSPKNINEDSVIAEYEFLLKGEDSYTYLYLEMKRINNEWKVQYFGLEK